MQFVSINDHTIHYNYIVNNSLGSEAETFLFINSLGTDFRIWDEVVESLKDYGNILLFDKRGHGLSDVVADTKSLDDFADDAAALLNYLHINKCIIIGLSIGGMIAQILAKRFPQQIEKLILCDTSYKIGNDEIWNTRIQQVKEHGLQSISAAITQTWFAADFKKTQPVKITGYQNMLERTPVSGYVHACKAIKNADIESSSKEIKMPTLCVVGSEDKSTLPGEVKKLSDLIQGSKYEVIEDSGHIPCADNPLILSKLIIDFIK